MKQETKTEARLRKLEARLRELERNRVLQPHEMCLAREIAPSSLSDAGWEIASCCSKAVARAWRKHKLCSAHMRAAKSGKLAEYDGRLMPAKSVAWLKRISAPK